MPRNALTLEKGNNIQLDNEKMTEVILGLQNTKSRLGAAINNLIIRKRPVPRSFVIQELDRLKSQLDDILYAVINCEE